MAENTNEEHKGGLWNFVRESYYEMTTKVTWTRYSELRNQSILVLVASLIFAILIGAMDLSFKEGMDQVYSLIVGGKA